MASLQSFQPSADRFCSWLTRIEETADKLEKDCEKLRAQYGNEHVPEHELQPFKVSDSALSIHERILIDIGIDDTTGCPGSIFDFLRAYT